MLGVLDPKHGYLDTMLSTMLRGCVALELQMCVGLGGGGGGGILSQLRELIHSLDDVSRRSQALRL